MDLSGTQQTLPVVSAWVVCLSCSFRLEVEGEKQNLPQPLFKKEGGRAN